jgi:PD-(D/E)XK nuclease superfamily
MIKPGYIRVSEILSQWPQFKGADPEIIRHKGEIGTEVHEAIMGFHENIHLPVREEAQGYYTSFLMWQQQNKCELKAVGRLYCEFLKITGEIDCLVEMDNKLCLVDWKTSASVNDKMWQLQGQFYLYLLSANKHQVSTTFYFIQLQKDGSFPKVKVYQSSKELLNVCMSAYVCYKYMKTC